MTKHGFLEELLRRLSQLPPAEQDKAYAFYAEIIDDRMEDGMSEEEAIAKLGSMDEIVERITAEVPMASLIKSRVRRKPRTTGAMILLVLGFPVWFPVLLSAAVVALTLFLVLWIMVLVLWVVFSSLAASAVGCLIGLLFFPETGYRLLLFGGALVCAGSAVLCLPACKQVTRQFAVHTRRLWLKGKSALMKRGRMAYETV